MTDFSIEKSIDGPVIGLDEVGRGPLAGPVVSCGCYFTNYDDLETEMVNSVIEEVGLSKFKFIKPFQLSGGQRTRVSLARSIVRSKPILLLDEAFSGLGPALRSEMIKLIKDKSIKERITLIMVSHHIKDAIELDQKVIFVNDGETMKPTNVSIFINSRDKNIRDYIGS